MLGIKNSHLFVSAGVRKTISELKHNRGRRHSLSADITILVEETLLIISYQSQNQMIHNGANFEFQAFDSPTHQENVTLYKMLTLWHAMICTH